MASDQNKMESKIFAVRTAAGREEQVMDFIEAKVKKLKMNVFSLLKPHRMKGYIFIEVDNLSTAKEAIAGIPYVRGILNQEIAYSEIEHYIEQGKEEIEIKKNDIVEIISGPFKGEQCKVTRIDKPKGEVVVQLLDSAVPIPVTVSIDSIKVIRREENA